MPPEESEWFEFSDQDWLEGFVGRKLKLIADEQVPKPVISEIAAAGITVKAASQTSRQHPDDNVLQLAQRMGRVLLTLDADFWNDRKFPLQTVLWGIIYVAESPSKHNRILRAFGLVYRGFAKSYPLNWWSNMKVKAAVGGFTVKMRTWEGRVGKYRMRLHNGRWVAKEIDDE